MKIFVAGATGVIGRRVVPQLVSAGHEVVGLSRSEEHESWLASHGAVARRGNLFDRDGLFDITADCEAVIHLATAVPTKSRTVLDDWVLNDRIRVEGTTNLIAAALRSSCKFYLQSSVTFLYGRQHGEWVDESCPPADDLPPMVKSSVEMERQVINAVTDEKLPATILRFGNVYSHDSAYTIAMYDLISRGKFPLIERGNAYWNLVSADDAAGAVVSAIKTAKKNVGKVFNICDDEPVLYRELVEFLARSLGAPKPASIPAFLARPALGWHTVDYLLQSVRCMNKRAKEDLKWHLHFPTYREGHEAILKSWHRRDGSVSGAAGDPRQIEAT
jgi:nucleoside-diphosphate-sugar epimerase